ncbi:MAG: hypothetical protein PVG94_09185 [Gammaproteobacteria bacterium]
MNIIIWRSLMHDYDNMPILDWRDDKAPQKAKAQILHQEPVILQMPDDFDASVDGDLFDCKREKDTGIFYDCEGGRILQQLATQNNLPALNTVAEACIKSSSQVDIDSVHKRIIVHD